MLCKEVPNKRNPDFQHPPSLTLRKLHEARQAEQAVDHPGESLRRHDASVILALEDTSGRSSRSCRNLDLET